MDPRSWPMATEACRILRANLEALRLEHPLQVLLLIPASPGEAAAEVALDLGLAFAEAGRQTLLVDADLERPQLHEALRVSPSPGLRALLAGMGSPIDAALAETGIPGLSLLPAGAPGSDPRPPSSRKVGELLQALRRRAERILIYSPPAQTASWTLELAEHSDGALLIARVRRTHRAHLLQAREALERVHATVLGVILWRA
ncbi:CpsD/CapB family tyrosine-protein kinase [Thermoflexus sp.]|uniref:CpsD/CapB family tyrosine-protein kinase n=1 Tax=Thermoflexus sp. TaxID=1969742 RepID=UPI0025F40FE9|nr:CpsD/CapB family tyrosine-protein kinase [Thermoflexus sp.]MDW8065166.1 CpsD/CapB family tyrosine-protein kinase [Anaerolineae bacterium]MCS6963046.1 CpsD/CapB family tyrosine-protein kinase [Thermoflexus sp.]MCS7351172.1 CpsD/CapB family tyrosine-protein kinase [Thermoflexus sp.]MCX7690817.1 CpsD/CapB family tyrosine-protein kinase [Thermoflexus sp.]MDW8180626.1 CpsD/CapB family tyrosine-protein kinase [Anaerolineae bacterium]